GSFSCNPPNTQYPAYTRESSNATVQSSRPPRVASRSGRVENEVIPRTARLISLDHEYWGRPAARSGRVVRTAFERKPSHERSPGTKRPRSGNASNSCTARRLSTEKSPLSTLTGLSARYE